MGTETKKVRITSQNWIDGMERYFPDIKLGDEIDVIEDENYPEDFLILGKLGHYGIPKTDCEVVTEEKEKLRVRIKSGSYYGEFPKETIFDATDMSNSDEQKYELHYNGQYFSCLKEYCEIVVAEEVVLSEESKKITNELYKSKSEPYLVLEAFTDIEDKAIQNYLDTKDEPQVFSGFNKQIEEPLQKPTEIKPWVHELLEPFKKTDSSRSEKIEITVDGNTYYVNRKAWTLEKELRKIRNKLFDGTISQEVYDLVIEILLP